MLSSEPGQSAIRSNEDLPPLMKAAVYQKPGQPMVIKKLPLPRFAQGEILVRIKAASLCGSDLVSYRGYLGSISEGLVGGHEAVGIVVAAHNSVKGYRAGDRVGFLNCLQTCDHCKPCLSGKSQFCETGKLNQGFDAPGFLAEFAVVKAQFAVHIPEALPLERLSPLFCAGITAFRAVKQLDLRERGVIGVFGLGGVGIFGVRFAKAMGFQVIGFDVSTTALALARDNGAIEAVDSSNQEAIEEVLKKRTHGRGLDSALVTAGVQSAFSAAITHVGFDGTIVAVGIPAKDIEVPVLAFVKKGLRLQGTQSGTPLELQQMLHIVMEHNILPEVDLRTIENVPEMMESLASGQATGKMGVVF